MINTKFWDDNFVGELNPTGKLLFLYLLTNPLTNLLGVYEITIRRIEFDTGIDKGKIADYLEGFAKAKKAFLIDDYIIIPNWLKNQELNSNMKKAVIKEFNALPNTLKEKIVTNGSEPLNNDNEAYINLLKHIREIEVESEDEIEDEKEQKIEGLDYDALLNFYNTTCKNLPQAKELNAKRISHINARLETYTKADIKTVIVNASKSEFLNGHNDKKFRANFDWLMLPTNFLKTLEGNYNSINGTPKQVMHAGSFDNDFKL